MSLTSICYWFTILYLTSVTLALCGIRSFYSFTRLQPNMNNKGADRCIAKAGSGQSGPRGGSMAE